MFSNPCSCFAIIVLVFVLSRQVFCIIYVIYLKAALGHYSVTVCGGNSESSCGVENLLSYSGYSWSVAQLRSLLSQSESFLELWHTKQNK